MRKVLLLVILFSGCAWLPADRKYVALDGYSLPGESRHIRENVRAFRVPVLSGILAISLAPTELEIKGNYDTSYFTSPFEMHLDLSGSEVPDSLGMDLAFILPNGTSTPVLIADRPASDQIEIMRDSIRLFDGLKPIPRAYKVRYTIRGVSVPKSDFDMEAVFPNKGAGFLKTYRVHFSYSKMIEKSSRLLEKIP